MRMKFKAKRALGAISQVGLIVLAASASAQAATTCNGVVKVNNDFYLAARSGSVIHRFTTDGTPKSSPVVSPDGGKIAYLVDDEQQTLLVANAQGGVGSFNLLAPAGDVNGATPTLGISWANNSLLQAKRHISPIASAFDHYSIPTAMDPGPTSLSPAYGRISASYCSIARITNYSACISDATVSVANDQVYFMTGFENSAPIQSVVIPVGSTASIPSLSGVQVNPTSILGGFTLNITYGGGTTTTRVPIGEVAPIVVNEAQYGLSPKLASGGVRIDLLENAFELGLEPLERVIAWRGADAQIVVIERSPSGKKLSLLERIGTTQPPVWGASAKASWPLDEDAKDIRFISPTLIYVKTKNEAALIPITIVKSNGVTTMSLGSVASLPNYIGVVLAQGGSPINSDVLDWSCIDN